MAAKRVLQPVDEELDGGAFLSETWEGEYAFALFPGGPQRPKSIHRATRAIVSTFKSSFCALNCPLLCRTKFCEFFCAPVLLDFEAGSAHQVISFRELLAILIRLLLVPSLFFPLSFSFVSLTASGLLEEV